MLKERSRERDLTMLDSETMMWRNAMRRYRDGISGDWRMRVRRGSIRKFGGPVDGGELLLPGLPALDWRRLRARPAGVEAVIQIDKGRIETS
jgi:hypothetical protein